MTVNVVLVREVDPPENDEPVEWLLLTSLPVDEIEHVRQVIQYYCVRWMIEMHQSYCLLCHRFYDNSGLGFGLVSSAA